jgi:hypothetical protein
MKIVILAVTALLTGCGTYGEPLLLARLYDNADRCQQNPYLSWCGAGSGKVYTTRDYRTNRITTQTTESRR